MKHGFLGIFLIISVSVNAEPPREVAPGPAWDAFVRGDYQLARNIGRTQNSADSLTVACRASFVIAGFLTHNQQATAELHSAIRDCANALIISPNHFDARVSLAVALSYEGKRTKTPAFPKRSRKMLEKLVKENPNSATAHGVLASWHHQVSAAGFLARIALGASRKKARHHFETAQELGNLDFLLRVEHLKYLASGSKKDRKQAINVAQALLAENPETKIDELLQKRCALILKALEGKRKSVIKAAIKAASAFSTAKDWDNPDDFPLDSIPDEVAG